MTVPLQDCSEDPVSRAEVCGPVQRERSCLQNKAPGPSYAWDFASQQPGCVLAASCPLLTAGPQQSHRTSHVGSHLQVRPHQLHFRWEEAG